MILATSSADKKNNTSNYLLEVLVKNIRAIPHYKNIG